MITFFLNSSPVFCFLSIKNLLKKSPVFGTGQRPIWTGMAAGGTSGWQAAPLSCRSRITWGFSSQFQTAIGGVFQIFQIFFLAKCWVSSIRWSVPMDEIIFCYQNFKIIYSIKDSYIFYIFSNKGWYIEFGTFFSIYWECHHPNWLSYFSEG